MLDSGHTKAQRQGLISRYQDQKRLLERAHPGQTAAEALDGADIELDELIYENSRNRAWTGIQPISLEDTRTGGENIPIVSFFTGCGGMDLGFEAAGFSHVAAFEHNKIFCETLRKNRPDWRVYGPPHHTGDVSDFESISHTLSDLISDPFDGVFIGGPPCQPFSIAANQRFAKSGINFKRIGYSHNTNGALLFDYIRLIVAFQPRVFIIENVSGLRDVDGGQQLTEAIDLLQCAGYSVYDPFILNAADLGLAQYRERLFVIGARSPGLFMQPPQCGHIGSGSVLAAPIPLHIQNHDVRNHKVGSLLRYMKLDYGRRDKLGRVDRLDPTRPSKTVIAGGANGGGRSHLHPEIPRTLSVRECARLQSFPDEYVFCGPTARQFTQVGNAVPPAIANKLADSVVRAYF